jgi:peptide deformylase
VDDNIRQLLDDMAETMYAAPGIGLAATQVDVHQRIIVVDVSEDKTDLRALINPRVVEADGKTTYEEGCLSVPGIYEEVERAEHIVVEALDRHGNNIRFEADGLFAICIQHEIDHLDGKVFVEKLSRLKQSRILAKLKKNQRKTL